MKFDELRIKGAVNPKILNLTKNWESFGSKNVLVLFRHLLLLKVLREQYI